MEPISKPSEKDFNQIFQLRKQISPYKRIPIDTKKQLMAEFLKVIILN